MAAGGACVQRPVAPADHADLDVAAVAGQEQRSAAVAVAGVALALGEAWRPAVVGGAVVPGVRSAVAVALEQVPEVRAADAVPGRRAEVAVVVGLAPGLDRDALDGVLQRVGAALAAEGVVAARVDSLEMRVVTARP